MPHLRIKPFPKNLVENEYAAKTWTLLRTAVEEILQKKPTLCNFEELYQHAYGMFLQKQGHVLYQSLQEVIGEHLTSKVPGDLSKANFLKDLNQVWQDFSAGMLLIKDIFMYMDRKEKSVERDQHSVYKMGLRLFRETVLHNGEVKENVQRSLLDLIGQERCGGVIEQSTVRSVCGMLMELGGGGRSVYEEDFERAFLANSATFFRAEARKYLATNNAGQFIRHVQRMIEAETERVSLYLDKTTQFGLDKLIDEEMIQTNLEAVVNMANGGVASLIQSRNCAEMAAMFRILSRVTEGMPRMLAAISLYLRQEGINLMTENGNNFKNPLQLIQALLDLKKKYHLFLEKSFNNDPRFRRMVAADFQFFFNQNKRAPELLSLFIDDQLKNASKNMTEQQLNGILEQAMTLFRYLREKEVFERFYKHHMARRLLVSRRAGDGSEKSMLSKLRHECGYSYTSKLEGMYRDILVSATFNEKFKDHCFQSNTSPMSFDLNVQVLTTGFWPMPMATANVVLPNDIQKGFFEFRKLYLAIHNGRQLNLQNNFGTAEISAEFYGAPEYAMNDKTVVEGVNPVTAKSIRKHILQVTTYQMCVVMLFNQRTEWSFQDLLTTSEISEKDLKRTLATLSTGKMKILLKLGGENSTRFIINDTFYSQLYRIKLNTGAKADFKEEQQDEEMKEAREKFESDRRHEVDAAIIRIMKGRQELEANELVAELIAHLRHRFTPSMDVIKTCIEGLIAKDYLSRSDENRSLYRYVA